jgi:hypothetical protein
VFQYRIDEKETVIMKKKRKLLIALGVLIVAFFVGILIIGAVAYRLYSRSAGDTESVFAPTEVGMPVGNKVTKDIGPAGGTLTSPDGKLILTVSQNALTETLPFSIQQITNKAAGGLGLAYRLEPDGKTFAKPLKISVRYDEHDLEGTVAEALSLAYQDGQGAWRAQGQIVLDQQAKTVTVPVTHFTDWSFLAKLRISPDKATIRTGEKLQMALVPCHFQSDFFHRLGRFLGGNPICELTNGKYYFDLQPNWFADIGRIDKPREIKIVYTAPSIKPSPNIATVTIPFEFESRGDTYDPPHRGMLVAHVTIIDRGYRAIGGTADVKYSGVICDLGKPFTIIGTYPSFVARFKFVPSSATAGTASYEETPGVQISTGAGTYTIEGSDTYLPKIIWSVSMKTVVPGVGSHSAGGTAPIQLVPLETDECK